MKRHQGSKASHRICDNLKMMFSSRPIAQLLLLGHGFPCPSSEKLLYREVNIGPVETEPLVLPMKSTVTIGFPTPPLKSYW